MDNVQFSVNGWEDFKHWLEQDKKTLKKILRLIDDIQKKRIYRDWQAGTIERRFKRLVEQTY